MAYHGNPYRFWRCRSKRQQDFIIKMEDWRADRKISRKLPVIKKLIDEDRVKRVYGRDNVIIPEDVEIPEAPEIDMKKLEKELLG